MDLKTVLASAGASAAVVAVGVPAMVSFVTLQPTTPGTADTGHTNVSGYSLAARFGAGTSPTLARVQVNETGPLQGVRAITSSGVSVYGQSTATTGLGAGGYFTTGSSGGRAVVADPLSTTGNTVGGLFYNHSSNANSVGVWGRVLGAGAAGTGVFGESAAPGGTALAALNGSWGNGVRAGTPDDSLISKGKLPRHEYSAGTPATMVPVAYGYLSTFGSILSGSGNFTAANISQGVVDVDILNYTSNGFDLAIVASAVETDGSQYASVQRSGATGDFRIICTDVALGVQDSDVTFVAYRSTGIAMPPMPEGLRRPKELDRYGEATVWAKKDPVGFEAWMAALRRWERANLKNRPYTVPDEGQIKP
ncbi:MAG: hypothetical protein JST30_07335 [Armatimonadetes bacterium]|nr:hypothetical protein [Armatimonadota bacterium]